jgi:hypothetical protein
MEAMMKQRQMGAAGPRNTTEKSCVTAKDIR